MDSTTRLIGNLVSFRTKYDVIQPLLERIKALVKEQ